MTESNMNQPRDEQPSIERPIEREILISRVLDGEASPEDWTAFRALAEQDTSLWGELAAQQQDHAELEAAVRSAIAVADGIEAPIREHAAEHFAIRVRQAGQWAGWAVAAVLTLAWGVHGQLGTGTQQASLGPIMTPPPTLAEPTPDEALDLYLTRGAEAGRVVGVMPDLVVMDSRPIEGGDSMEVLYLRQIIERHVIEDASEVRRDELGNPIAAPTQSRRVLGTF